MIKDGTVYCDQCHASIPKTMGVAYLNGVICWECYVLLRKVVRPRTSVTFMGVIGGLLCIPIVASALALFVAANSTSAEHGMGAAATALAMSIGLWLLAYIAHHLQRISGQRP